MQTLKTTAGGLLLKLSGVKQTSTSITRQQNNKEQGGGLVSVCDPDPKTNALRHCSGAP